MKGVKQPVNQKNTYPHLKFLFGILDKFSTCSRYSFLEFKMGT